MRKIIIPFIFASVIGKLFIVGKFPGNESFKNEIASLFSDLYLFNFSEVRKKLVKAFATVFFFYLLVFPCPRV